MNQQQIESLKQDYLDYLQNNENEVFNLRHFFKILNITNDKEKKEIAKMVYKDFNYANLSFSSRKGESTIITKITPNLRKLVDNNHLDFDEQRNIVKLTKANSIIIEKLILNDDNYFPFSKIIYDYYEKNKVQKNIDNALFAVVREIDRDNSTNVWRYKENRTNFNKAISYMSNPQNNFFIRLEKGEISLPDELVDICTTGLKSLSSKICKYLSEWMFPNKDSYYINDKFVRRTVLFYLDYYDLEKKVNDKSIKSSRQVDDLSYESLFYLLDELRKKASYTHKDGGLTKSELDHILWYCYKSFKA